MAKIKHLISRTTRIETAPAPTVHNLPPQNRYFTGRHDELTRIQTALKDHFTVLVTGQGGFGKTETAVEYAYLHESEYRWIWYFNAESEVRLRDEIRSFAIRIGLPAETANDPNRAKAYIAEWFADNLCLLIYDNAEGCPQLREYLPRGHANGHILINSRERLRITGGFRLETTVFSTDDAIAFVKKRVKDISDDDAQRLSHSLGRLPLALEQAVSYMKENDYTCERYLDQLRRYGLRMLDTPSADTDYDKTVTTTWNITFDKLKENAQSDPLSQSAVQLLNLCAYCAPDDVPLRMFIAGHEQLPSPLRETLDPKDEPSHDKLVGKLADLSILSKRRDNHHDGWLLSIHRLIQAVVSHNLRDDTQWLSHCLDATTVVFDYTYDSKPSFERFSETLPHALEIARHIEQIFSDDEKKREKAARLYHKAGFGLNEQGDYAQALEWYQKALAIREKVLGSEHPDTATSYNNIGYVYYAQGDYAQALAWYLKALAICKKVLGSEHSDTAATYNNIAGVYDDQGDYAQALEWYQKALAIQEKVLGSEHPSTATTYNNIAGVYDNQGDYDQALEWYLNALAIQEKVLGSEHPDTATTYNNIALVYDNQGDYAEALEWYQKALAIREKVLGSEHPDTAATYNNIALVYSNQGDYDQALVWYLKALTIKEKVLGSEHPSTATTYHNIASVYKNQGDYAQALVWYLKSYRICDQKLGAAHPHTKIVLGNMERAYATAGYAEDFDAWLQKELGTNE